MSARGAAKKPPAGRHEGGMAVRQEAGVDCQDDHKHEENHHHNLRYLLNTVLESDDDDSCCHQKGDSHVDDLQQRISCQCPEE